MNLWFKIFLQSKLILNDGSSIQVISFKTEKKSKKTRSYYHLYPLMLSFCLVSFTCRCSHPLEILIQWTVTNFLMVVLILLPHFRKLWTLMNHILLKEPVAEHRLFFSQPLFSWIQHIVTKLWLWMWFPYGPFRLYFILIP